MAPYVVLDRIEPGQPAPEYCIHGRVSCVGCQDWCWLGSETVGPVKAGQLRPLCHQCVIRFVGPETQRVGHLDDHRRVAGPHS